VLNVLLALHEEKENYNVIDRISDMSTRWSTNNLKNPNTVYLGRTEMKRLYNQLGHGSNIRNTGFQTLKLYVPLGELVVFPTSDESMIRFS
jgi:hypothetical protein